MSEFSPNIWILYALLIIWKILLEISLEISHIVRSSETINRWVGPGQFTRLIIGRRARSAIYKWSKPCKILEKYENKKFPLLQKRILTLNSWWTSHLPISNSHLLGNKFWMSNTLLKIMAIWWGKLQDLLTHFAQMVCFYISPWKIRKPGFIIYKPLCR